VDAPSVYGEFTLYNVDMSVVACSSAWVSNLVSDIKGGTQRVYNNRVLRRIFGPKTDEVMEGWRKLQNEELHDLYSSPSIIRMMKFMRMRWTGHVSRMGEKRNMYRLLTGKPEGKRPLNRPR
jgi:hypothetical protein